MCLQGFGEKHYVKKPLERPRHRWENNIKLDLKEIDWVFVDWIDVFRDKDKLRALVRMVMNKLEQREFQHEK